MLGLTIPAQIRQRRRSRSESGDLAMPCSRNPCSDRCRHVRHTPRLFASRSRRAESGPGRMARACSRRSAPVATYQLARAFELSPATRAGATHRRSTRTSRLTPLPRCGRDRRRPPWLGSLCVTPPAQTRVQADVRHQSIGASETDLRLDRVLPTCRRCTPVRRFVRHGLGRPCRSLTPILEATLWRTVVRGRAHMSQTKVGESSRVRATRMARGARSARTLARRSRQRRRGSNSSAFVGSLVLTRQREWHGWGSTVAEMPSESRRDSCFARSETSRRSQTAPWVGGYLRGPS